MTAIQWVVMKYFMIKCTKPPETYSTLNLSNSQMRRRKGLAVNLSTASVTNGLQIHFNSILCCDNIAAELFTFYPLAEEEMAI